MLYIENHIQPGVLGIRRHVAPEDLRLKMDNLEHCAY